MEYNEDTDSIEVENTRAKRRRNDYLKAKRFKKNMIDIFGTDWWEEQPIGKFVKNTSINETPGFRGYYRTKNKGPNHKGTYAPSFNPKFSEIKKIEKMNQDQEEFESENST